MRGLSLCSNTNTVPETWLLLVLKDKEFDRFFTLGYVLTSAPFSTRLSVLSRQATLRQPSYRLCSAFDLFFHPQYR